jgi:uncharacterized protein YbjT (DUF2867 family)
MRALIIGATGATGKDLLDLLLRKTNVESVDIFVRRDPELQNNKLRTHVVNFDKPESWNHLVKGDVLFSCLGTTRKAAGSKKAQYKVDYEYQYHFAETAKKNGVERYVLISARNASPKSLFFYSRIKGKLEEAVKKLGFEQLIILRPPLLERKDSDRKAEVLAVKIVQFLNKRGLLQSQRTMPTELLAKAMCDSLEKFGQGTFVIDNPM